MFALMSEYIFCVCWFILTIACRFRSYLDTRSVDYYKDEAILTVDIIRKVYGTDTDYSLFYAAMTFLWLSWQYFDGDLMISTQIYTQDLPLRPLFLKSRLCSSLRVPLFLLSSFSSLVSIHLPTKIFFTNVS